MKFNVPKSLTTVFFLCSLVCIAACKKGEPTPEQPTPVSPDVPSSPAPVITSISSSSGSYGDYLSIEGANFSTTTTENIVKINNKAVYVHQANPNTIVFAVPKGVGSGPLTLTVKGKTATYPNFTYVKGLLVSRFAGNGTAGYLDGKDLQNQIGFVTGTQLLIDQDDNIYSNDLAYLIRKTSPNATITTIAGDINLGQVQDGPVSVARFDVINNIAIDKLKNIYVTESAINGSSLRKISSDGIVSTLLKADTRRPSLIVTDADNNLYVLLIDKTILKINSSGTVLGTYGPFNLPDGFGSKMMIDSKNNLYFMGNTKTAIYKVTLGGNIAVLAGKKDMYGNVDGLGEVARFNYVGDFIIDKNDVVYVLQNSQLDLIRKVDPDGTVTTLYKRPQSAVVYIWPIDEMARPLSTYKIPDGKFVRDSKGNFFIWDRESFFVLKCQLEL